MDGVLDADRYHGGESGTGRGGGIPDSARSNEIDSEAGPGSGLPNVYRILGGPRQVVRHETADPVPISGTAVMVGSKERKTKAKLLGKDYIDPCSRPGKR